MLNDTGNFTSHCSGGQSSLPVLAPWCRRQFLQSAAKAEQRVVPATVLDPPCTWPSTAQGLEGRARCRSPVSSCGDASCGRETVIAAEPTVTKDPGLGTGPRSLAGYSYCTRPRMSRAVSRPRLSVHSTEVRVVDRADGCLPAPRTQPTTAEVAAQPVVYEWEPRLCVLQSAVCLCVRLCPRLLAAAAAEGKLSGLRPTLLPLLRLGCGSSTLCSA